MPITILGMLCLLFVTPDIAQAAIPGEDSIKSILWFIIVGVFGWLFGIAGLLLDFAIDNFIVNFGATFTSKGVGVAVDALWVTVRDFFNIIFIFGLVYLGFKMILNSDDSGTRQALVYLIMAALLVNFSLFITKFVVDFSNVLASEVVKAGFTSNAGGELRVADTFFGYMRVSNTLEMPQSIRDGNAGSWAYIFGNGIIYLIGIFVFAAGAIMLIIRFVALSIYMVLSPFMFIGWVFPGFKGQTGKYWRGFLGRAFYAPVYVLLIYFAAFIMNNMFGTGLGDGGSYSIAPGGAMQDAVFAEIIGPFLLVSAFLIAAVQVAGKLSADGASTVMNVGNNMVRGGRRRLQNGAMGMGRFAVRNTAGSLNRKITNNLAEGTRRGLNTINANISQSGVWGSRAASRLSDRTLGAGLDWAANSSIAGAETSAQRRKRVNTQNAKLNTIKQENSRSNETVKDLKIIASSGSSSEDIAKARGRLAGNIAKMSNDEIANFDLDTLKNEEFAQNMTDAQIKAVRESGIYTNSQGKAIAQANINGTQNRFAESLDSATASVKELNATLDQLAHTIGRMSTDKLADLGAEEGKDNQWLLNDRVAMNLSEKQLDDLRNSGKVSTSQLDDIYAARERGLTTLVNGNTDGDDHVKNIVNASDSSRRDEVLQKRREKLFQGSAKAAGELPASVFAQPEVAHLITPAALAERDRNGLSSEEVKAIQENIEEYITSKKATNEEKDKWVGWSKSSAGAQSRFNFAY